LPDQLPASLLGRRPDVVAARLQAQALESRVASQQAEFYPDVNLSAFVGVQSLGLDMLTEAAPASPAWARPSACRSSMAAVCARNWVPRVPV
jgi:outer membrane protein TolC